MFDLNEFAAGREYGKTVAVRSSVCTGHGLYGKGFEYRDLDARIGVVGVCLAFGLRTSLCSHETSPSLKNNEEFLAT